MQVVAFERVGTMREGQPAPMSVSTGARPPMVVAAC
jgi:hypothetical protein